MNNRYPEQEAARRLQGYGRYGDDVLVHMNPIEVAGLASLSPTGSLTTNPVTGQPEAFLPLLIPLLASWGGSAAVGAGALGAGLAGSTLAAGIAGGVASGVATGAITGDWERGLASGIMGAGIGGALGAAGSAAGEAATAGATELGAELAIDTVGQEAGTLMGDVAAQEAALATQASQQAAVANMSGLQPSTALMEGGLDTTGSSALTEVGSGFSGESYMQALKQPFQEDSGLGSELMKQKAMLPILMGGSQLSTLEAEDDAENAANKQEKENEAQREASYDRLQAAYRLAQPNAPTGLSPHRKQMFPDFPGPWHPGMAAGGMVRMGTGGRTGRGNKNPIADGGGYGGGYGFTGVPGDDYNYAGIDPVTIQRGLRGAHSVRPPDGFRPGIDPEFQYFQDDPDNIEISDPTNPQSYMPFQRMEQPDQPYFKSLTGGEDGAEGAVLPQIAEMAGLVNTKAQHRGGPAPDPGYAAGGDVQLNNEAGMPMGSVAPGGIADIQNQYTAPPQAMPEAGGEPSEQDIQRLAMAVLGKAGDQANLIVEDFVQRFGPEMFQEARDFILKQMMPNAQTEGMIQGQGGGMDDQVPGMIGDQQPVAVSPGEYIVPADVVSGIGDGSSDAGAAELDRMSGDVRMARGGTTTQPPAFDARQVMPR